MDLKSFLQTKFATVLLSGMLILVMIVTAKLMLQKREVEGEIKELEERADKIHKDNQELSELIKYFNTPEYTELQAREKLNLKKEGEYVVVLPQEQEPEGVVAGASNTERNPKKWYNYFFGENL